MARLVVNPIPTFAKPGTATPRDTLARIEQARRRFQEARAGLAEAKRQAEDVLRAHRLEARDATITPALAELARELAAHEVAR